MTYSICAREEYRDDAGAERTRYGVAVTTRVPGVGSVCPFISKSAAVSTQAVVNPELGRKGVRYIGEGLFAADALRSLLDADGESSQRQLHGVGEDTTFTHTGEECGPWCGHTSGKNYTVAGNRLAGERVVDRVSETYQTSDWAEPLEKRLIDALEAGYEAGGDRREDELPVQSAALRVRRTEPTETMVPYNDIRIDATETPMRDLRATYELARDGYDMFLEYKERRDD